MKVEIDLDEAEVLALRTGGQVPLSLRDKLGDAVHIREVGWYLVNNTSHSTDPRPRWWSGEAWYWGPEGVRHGQVAIVHDDAESERLYLADER